jgi:hypothetical protein
MNAPLSQKNLLDVMASCRHSVDTDNLEQILGLFAERLARVSEKLTAVEMAGLVLIGAAIGKHIQKEVVPAVKLIVFRRVERRKRPRFHLRSIG